ncbi:MAG: 50S ribosomal protein L1 [Gammaproteobacteria bacterium]|jgi:large subunit ribosomal protein L1|nr:50S ribosomal protein L1 [Gammaproteobacteria bacterium]|tara:strand:+ start:2829 stop:3512 length:684 start_codon:yes stop_codon:yes gene_type:complete
MKNTKYKKELPTLDLEKVLSIDEAVETLLNQPKRKFTESVDIAVSLGIDPKKSDQNVRGSLTLPHSLGKDVKIVAFVDGDKATEAKDAGADFVGTDDLLEKYKDGNIDFDVAITTPSMMKVVSKLAKVLGPKGLMPNPKSGTVTENIEKAVKDVKHGQVRFKTEKEGIVQGTIANSEMDKTKLTENLNSFMAEIKRLKPASSKGIYIQDIYLSTTMGPGYRIDVSQF